MAGKTGKRAKRPAPCRRCGRKIEGGFMRRRDGDYHTECWWIMMSMPVVAHDKDGKVQK